MGLAGLDSERLIEIQKLYGWGVRERTYRLSRDDSPDHNKFSKTLDLGSTG